MWDDDGWSGGNPHGRFRNFDNGDDDEEEDKDEDEDDDDDDNNQAGHRTCP